MFKINLSAAYFWPVTVKLPADGGRVVENNFEVQFKRLSQTRILEITASVGERESTFVDVCKEIMLDWKEVHDADNKAVPYSDDARDRLLDVAGVPAAIALAFLDSARGIKVKN